MAKKKSAINKNNPAVFIDRDGTINVESGYINHLDRFKLLPKIPEAISLLNKKKIMAVVVTNQAGAARGYFPLEFINRTHEKMLNLLKKRGASLDGVYFCAHHPEEKCLCRKPAIGLIEIAAHELSIDINNSYMIGDKFSDMEMAKNAGMKGVMVLTGYGKGELEFFRSLWEFEPDYIASNLLTAVKWIIKDINAKKKI